MNIFDACRFAPKPEPDVLPADCPPASSHHPSHGARPEPTPYNTGRTSTVPEVGGLVQADADKLKSLLDSFETRLRVERTAGLRRARARYEALLPLDAAAAAEAMRDELEYTASITGPMEAAVRRAHRADPGHAGVANHIRSASASWRAMGPDHDDALRHIRRTCRVLAALPQIARRAA